MRAFSLVELSIVLVILGLLTGGILAGQSLIRAAELRSVVSDYQRYMAAVHMFRAKYMALPGDMPTATRFWGKMADYCNSDPGTASANGTCNGDGDGWISTIAAGTPNSTSEETQTFRQLALADLIEGAYTGVTDGGGDYDLPKSRLSRGTWRMRTLGNLVSVNPASSLASTFGVAYGTVLELYSSSSTGGYILTPSEAWNLDTKLDDGRPASGRMVIRAWQNCTSASSRADLTAVYAVSSPDRHCMTIFFPNL